MIVFPPEWAHQSGVMLTWPHRNSYWFDTLDAIDQVFVDVAFQVALREKVWITCFDQAHEHHITHLLKKAKADCEQIIFYHAPTNDIWVRDHGPICVLQNQQPLLLDFTFTGWGYKYPAEFDNQLTQNLYAQKAFGATSIQTIAMALEGGGIETDGEGTLLVTRQCLLSTSRNPSLKEAGIETVLRQSLGVKRILWLSHGSLEGDDTDGHIDTLARFVDPHTIAYVACPDEGDAHFDELKAMEAELRSLKDYEGKPYRLIPLPWPKPRYATVDNRRLPITYANFLMINDAVLVPTYEDEARDQEALAILKDCFPDRAIVGIPALPVVQWYGSIHCMTMQLPRGVLT